MKKFSEKQLAVQQKFKEMIERKKAAAAAKKAGTPAETVKVSETVQTSGNGIYIAIAVVIIAGLVYWYFTKDKK